MANESLSSQNQESTQKLSSFVRRYCERDVVCAKSDTPLEKIARLMRENHIGDVVIVDESSCPIGIVTDRDLVIETVGRGKDFDNMTADDVMTRDVAVAKAGEPVEEMIRIMRREGVGRLPLVDEQGTIAGIITAKNLMVWLISELSQLMEGAEKQQDKELEIKH